MFARNGSSRIAPMAPDAPPRLAAVLAGSVSSAGMLATMAAATTRSTAAIARRPWVCTAPTIPAAAAAPMAEPRTPAPEIGPSSRRPCATVSSDPMSCQNCGRNTGPTRLVATYTITTVTRDGGTMKSTRVHAASSASPPASERCVPKRAVARVTRAALGKEKAATRT